MRRDVIDEYTAEYRWIDNLIRWTIMGTLLVLSALFMALLVHGIRVGNILDIILGAVATLGTATGFCALLDRRGEDGE